MNLIISSITIVDLTNKQAKKVEFSPSKNLLTSDQNHFVDAADFGGNRGPAGGSDADPFQDLHRAGAGSYH